MLYEVLSYIFYENDMFLEHILNLFVLTVLLVLFFMARKTKKKWSKINDYLGNITKTVDSIRYGNLTKKLEKIELPNYELLTDSINRMIETLNDREKMIDEYQTDLNRQNKYLEAVINSLSDGLLIVNVDYKIIRATPKISEWFGISGRNLINTNIFKYIKLSNRQNLEKLKNEDITIISNTESNFVASSMELKLDDNKRRFVIIIKNVTNEREIENLKEDFIATLTHDLKVPIIAETNMLELFLNKSFGEISQKQEIALKNMQISNKELLDLVQTVLETYKIKDGKITLYKENILLKSFIEDIIEEMLPITKKTNNNIVFSTSHDIRVFADKFQLKRVLKNFIHNAISYGEPNSPIEIRIGEIPKFIVIKVKDYGSGISKIDIEKIFNRYYSAAKKFRKIGTGLGLYLSQQIIKAHHGEVSVESKEGEFTEFTVKLPAVVDINLHYGE